MDSSEARAGAAAQCRHGFDSFLDTVWIGEARADRYTVGDRYRHRLQGQLTEDAERLEDYRCGDVAEVVTLPTSVQTGAKEAQAASLSGTG